jgi:hypothetical protein
MCHHLMPEMVAALARDGDHRHEQDTREPETEPDEAVEQPAAGLVG